MHAQQNGDSAPLSAKATLGVSVDVMEGMEGIKEGVDGVLLVCYWCAALDDGGTGRWG